MIRKLIVVLIIALVSNSVSAQEKFKISRENKSSQHVFGINVYSFVHHICPDSFFMTELYRNLDYDEMASITKEIYHGVTDVDKVRIDYNEVDPTTAKIAYYIRDDPEKGKMFIMFTNFNNATRKFDPKPDPKDQLARWYFLKNDRLIYRKDLYTVDTEQIKLNSDRKSDIIKYYLFDDNPSNDDKIKPLIDKILESGDNGPDNYFAQIYQIQFYMMNGQMENAGEALKRLENYFFLNEAIPRNQKIYLNMVKAEYEVMNRL